MRMVALFFVFLLPMLAFGQNYRVSQLSFENFRAYPDFNISGDDIRQVITRFATATPIVEQSGLFLLAAQLADIYRAKGLVFHRVEVSLTAPVKLVLVPGVVSAVDIRGTQRYRNSQLTPFFDDLYGRLVDNRTLQESMLQINAMPGVSGFAFLSFGALPGDAVVNVSIDDQDWGRLSTRVTNYGTENTGEYRLSSQLTLNNTLKMGEQWRLSGSISDQTENWSSALGVDLYRGARHRYLVSASIQQVAVTQQFSLLDMKGWQASAELGYRFSPSKQYANTLTFTVQTGVLYQSLENKAGISSLDINMVDLPLDIAVSGDMASVKQFFGYESAVKAGWLESYEAPVQLENDYWALYQGSLSYARSITAGALQRGIDVKAQLSGQYAFTELPAHRRFALAGPTKLASLAAGSLSGNTGIFTELAATLLTLNAGPVQSSLQIGGQAGWGQTEDETTDVQTALGATIDINVGAFKTQNKLYADPTFDHWRWWFELTLDWPKGK